MPDTTFRKNLYSYILKNETIGGKPALKVYKDIKGIPTIGVGHKLKPTEKFTSITEQQAEDLFNQDVQEKINYVVKDIGEAHWKELPEPVQIALTDFDFRGDWRGSPKATQFFKDKKYYAAAKEMLDSDEYRESKEKGTGIAPRMERNVQAIVDLGNAKHLDLGFEEAVEARLSNE
jgi:GH24 family phage-related lysozyme (muramidase)